MSVLVVDDDKDMRDLIVSLLSPTYRVITAENGKEALQVLDEQNIRLVISDVAMPEIDGLELLKRIRSDEKFAYMPVILLTAKVAIQDKLDGLGAGADVYIEKPFSSNLLLSQISTLLSNREKIREFYFKSPIANMKSEEFSKADKEFLDKLNAYIVEHMADEGLDVNSLADYMNVSRPTLYRKVNAVSKVSPNELIRIARLKRAAQLLLDGKQKIYEVSEAVGFKSQSYFWSSFTKQFGVSPSQYIKNNKSDGKE